MRIEVRVSLVDSAGQRFMGAGPLLLLEGVRRSGSIRQAAQEMGMSYAKAHRILGRLEEALGWRLLVRRIGGAQRGGAELTSAGQQFLESYSQLQQDVRSCADSAFRPFSLVCGELRGLPDSRFPAAVKAGQGVAVPGRAQAAAEAES